MQYLYLIFVSIALTACASAGKSSSCPYRNLIGQNAYTADTSAITENGKEVRLLYPDSYLGFKSDPNRVNITRDENDQIVDVTCG